MLILRQSSLCYSCYCPVSQSAGPACSRTCTLAALKVIENILLPYLCSTLLSSPPKRYPLKIHSAIAVSIQDEGRSAQTKVSPRQDIVSAQLQLPQGDG